MRDTTALTVLLGDDDPDTRRLHGRARRDDAARRADGLGGRRRGGVKVATDAAPWAAILDLGMPRLDGFQVAHRLRQSMGNAIPILISVSGDYKRLQEGCGVFDYSLREPLQVQRLALSLARAAISAGACGDGEPGMSELRPG